MNEGFPTPNNNESRETQKDELLVLAKELYESNETFPFPGLEPESYAKLKASDEEFPGYTTPTDDILERCKNEGIKVVLGKNPESGNIFILPAGSNDIENDMIFPQHFKSDGVSNERLRRLIELSKATTSKLS